MAIRAPDGGNNPTRAGKESKEIFGFPTTEAPPFLKADLPTTKALKEFQVGMQDLIREIKLQDLNHPESDTSHIIQTHFLDYPDTFYFIQKHFLDFPDTF